MKIGVCSDLHLEFGDLDLRNDNNVDVLVLSGDIFIANELNGFVYDENDAIVTATSFVRKRANRYNDFIVRCSKRFKHVILIMGNHEHYHGDFTNTTKIIRGAFGDLHNVHFLDKEWIIIDGVLFFGGTLWTDMNNEDPKTMRDIMYMMNDFNKVKNTAKDSNRHFKVFHPSDAVEDHKEFKQKLDDAFKLHPSLPVVVCGHHAPSKASTHPRYATEVIMNGAYSSDLDNFILDRRQIKLWTHGHTHEDFDYMIGTTRIVCNPRGYDGYEERADRFKLKVVEI